VVLEEGKPVEEILDFEVDNVRAHQENPVIAPAESVGEGVFHSQSQVGAALAHEFPGTRKQAPDFRLLPARGKKEKKVDLRLFPLRSHKSPKVLRAVFR